MAQTVVGVNDPRAVKRWSGFLQLDQSQKGYFSSRFMGKGNEAQVPIQIHTDLEKDAGDELKFDLLSEMRMAPIEGDDTLEGKEEAQRFHTDSIRIDQARCGVNSGGRMTQKRTLHDLRARARMQQSNWWARFMDEICFIYLSGARGVNANFLLDTSFAGRANNPLTAPTAQHQLFGGDATSFATIDATDVMSLDLIGRAASRAATQGGGATSIPVLQPVVVDGEETFVCLMHTWQEDALRANTSQGQWLDIQKAAAGAIGNNSPIFRKSLGMYRGVVLHSHRNVIRFNNAGAGANVNAARALFLGSQAGVLSYGSDGRSMRISWNEETRDNGNKTVITSSSIFGFKKTTYNIDGTPHDFGVFAMDTAVTPA